MKPILTSAEAAALDLATRERGTDAATLMERAGHAVARAAQALAGGRYGRRVTVVCGGGNNGGDGFVAARLLDSWGLAVTVVTVGPPTEREPARAARRAAEDAGVRFLSFDAAALDRELGRSDAAVDAIAGIGFSGPLRGEMADAISGLDGAPCPILAVDVPSGLEDRVGEVAMAVHADATVTFGVLKTVLLSRSDWTGPVEVVDIGLSGDAVAGGISLVEVSDVVALLPRRGPSAHKRDAVVMVVGGTRTMSGAVALAASGAMRGGAGLVRIAAPSEIVPVLGLLAPTATFIAMPMTGSGGIDDVDDEAFREALSGADAVVIGPGAGRDPSTSAFIRGLVARLEVPAVLDADGLWAFDDGPAAGPAGLVCTPHAGEAGRMLRPDEPAADVDRVGAARAISGRTGAVVLLKGPQTLVVSPDGRTTVNPTGGPSLATGGTGDVLAGLIGALLARGLAPHDAAMVGAYVHGYAGDILNARSGDGATALDLAAAIPEAIAEVNAA